MYELEEIYEELIDILLPMIEQQLATFTNCQHVKYNFKKSNNNVWKHTFFKGKNKITNIKGYYIK